MNCATETEWLRKAAATDDDAAAGLTGTEEFHDAADAIRGMHLHVLIVDDDSMFRDGLATRLRGTYLADVEPAEDALMALQMLTEMSAFDLVLMDVEMPEIDGIETCSRMQDVGGFGHIVLMSATARNRQRVLDFGEEFLYKSQDPDSFTAALEQILLHCRRARTP